VEIVWRPVHGDMPDAYIPILIYAIKEDSEPEIALAYMDCSGRRFDCLQTNREWDMHTVIAWMPLPEAPTKEWLESSYRTCCPDKVPSGLKE
jgi:hypothetical protein